LCGQRVEFIEKDSVQIGSDLRFLHEIISQFNAVVGI